MRRHWLLAVVAAVIVCGAWGGAALGHVCFGYGPTKTVFSYWSNVSDFRQHSRFVNGVMLADPIPVAINHRHKKMQLVYVKIRHQNSLITDKWGFDWKQLICIWGKCAPGYVGKRAASFEDFVNRHSNGCNVADFGCGPSAGIGDLERVTNYVLAALIDSKWSKLNNLNRQPWALADLGQFISLARLIESGLNQKNTYGAQSHSDEGGDSHNLGPPSGHFLRSQVLFFALIFTSGLVSLGYAIYLGGRGRADPYYVVFGVLAVYLGAIGSLVL